jgi:hypothetical protein
VNCATCPNRASFVVDGKHLCRKCVGADMGQGEFKAVRLMAGESMSDDSARGYRLACRPIAMVEQQVAELLHRCGGQTMALVLQHGVRVGVPEQETMHAVIRLLVKGKVHYDLPLGTLTRVPPTLGFWRRLINRFRGGVHPALVLVACVGVTAFGCAFWAYVRSLSV